MTYLLSIQGLISSQRRRIASLAILAALGSLTISSLHASERTASDVSMSQCADQNNFASVASRQPALIADGWTWGQAFSPVKSALASRARMLQFGAIGCCIALYIIWWRK
ncbi:MAG TPA: hypothetical protein VGZ25_08820 [Gemmataceae bacterium]|nr:hypothetical protein [Gemmataceae bacterium]